MLSVPRRFTDQRPRHGGVDLSPIADQLVLDGRYRLGDVLGRGGMGEVRAAEDLRLGRSVAVKLLRADLASDPDLRGRFEAEARAAARVSHPHAVAVYDAGEDEGIAYLVMERLPGATLADEVATGPLDQERACAVAGQVLGALGVAHDSGLIHRDIKPGNVLLTADGAAKLADFGIAKVIEKNDDATTGFLLGTPAYLAPERLAGHPATPPATCTPSAWCSTRHSPGASRSTATPPLPSSTPSTRASRSRCATCAPMCTRQWWPPSSRRCTPTQTCASPPPRRSPGPSPARPRRLPPLRAAPTDQG